MGQDWDSGHDSLPDSAWGGQVEALLGAILSFPLWLVQQSLCVLLTQEQSAQVGGRVQWVVPHLHPTPQWATTG